MEWRDAAAEFIANEKAAGRKARAMPDLSQHGNGEPFRNETLNGAPFPLLSGDRHLDENGIESRQEVPESGIIQFDLVELPVVPGTPVKYAQGSAMSDELYQLYKRKIRHWGGAYQGEEIDVKWVKAIAAHQSFTAGQVAGLIAEACADPEDPTRVDLAMLLWARIRDPRNGYKVLTVAGSQENHQAMLARIGWLRLFNPFWPDRGNTLGAGEWIFDLNSTEERSLASILLRLGTSGTDGRILRAAYKKSENKKEKERRLGLEQLVEMAGGPGGAAECLLPDKGSLRFVFDVHGEDCHEDLTLRKALAEERLGWNLPPINKPKGGDPEAEVLRDWLDPFLVEKAKAQGQLHRQLSRLAGSGPHEGPPSLNPSRPPSEQSDATEYEYEVVEVMPSPPLYPCRGHTL